MPERLLFIAGAPGSVSSPAPASASVSASASASAPAASSASALLGGLLALAVLSGCGQLPLLQPPPAPAPVAPEPAPPPPPPPPVIIEAPPSAPPLAPTDAAARRLLAFNDYLRQLSAAELTQEVARLNALASATPSAANFLEFALALGLTRNNGDLARATGLIEPLLRSTAPDVVPWQPFARFLNVRYAEQRRLEEALDRQIKEQRDTRNRLDQANEKLEALKAIERSLISPRPAPGRGSPLAPTTSSGPATPTTKAP